MPLLFHAVVGLVLELRVAEASQRVVEREVVARVWYLEEAFWLGGELLQDQVREELPIITAITITPSSL